MPNATRANVGLVRFLGLMLISAVVVMPSFATPVIAANPSPTDKTIAVDADFTWDGVRNCDKPRPNSVICIAAQAKIDGLGLVEYARDAVPTGETTPDGCSEYSTHGSLWVPGGTAQFDGVPVPTCGADDSPDAHYEYTLRDGTGVLAGATGTGDVVADNGVDRWHGTITLAAKSTANGGGASAGPFVGGIVGAVVVIVAAAVLWRSERVSRRRRRSRLCRPPLRAAGDAHRPGAAVADRDGER